MKCRYAQLYINYMSIIGYLILVNVCITTVARRGAAYSEIRYDKCISITPYASMPDAFI